MAKFMKIILAFTVFSISLIVIGVIAAKTLKFTGHSSHINDFLHRYKIGIMVWRYSLMALVIAFWPRLIRWLHRYSEKPQALIDGYARRRVILAILVLYELIIVQNGIGFVISHIL